MKILLIAPRIPILPFTGLDLMVFNTIKEISKKHEIYLLGFIEGESSLAGVSRVKPYCSKIYPVLLQKRSKIGNHFDQLISFFKSEPRRVIQFNNKEMHIMIKTVLSEFQIDVVHIMWFVMGQYVVDLPENIKKIITPPDCLSPLLSKLCTGSKNPVKKIYYYFQYLKMREYEKRIYSQYDACYFVTENDAGEMKKICPNLMLQAIPNGVDTSYFKPLDTPQDYPSLIFTGSMRYLLNVNAVIYFCDKIFPLVLKEFPTTRFYVVGKAPPSELMKLRSKNVIITGMVEDIRPWIDKATLSICPIRIGVGIKNKVLEAMAMEKPIVATSVSCQGINVSDGENIFIRDGIEEFADCIIKLFKNPAERKRIGKNARVLAKQSSWEKTGRQVEALYERLLGQSPR